MADKDEIGTLDDFLDDIETVEAESLAAEGGEITDEAAELDALRAERNELQDKWRAIESAADAGAADGDDATAALVEGVERTMRERLNVFRKHGIEPITPEVGDRFDPQEHQAMFEAPVPGTRAGDIIQVAAEGFRLHDRLLRPAQVGVSSMPAG